MVVLGWVAVLIHSAAWPHSAPDDVLAGPGAARTSAPATTGPPARAEAAPPAARAAAHQLVLSLGAPAGAVTVRGAHGLLERASALEDSILAMGFTSAQQAWVIEADSALPLTCTTCFGVVPVTGRAHGLIVLDSPSPQPIGSYVRGEPADLRPFGDIHELAAPY